MRPFLELPRREKLIEALRWLCVLPAAGFAERAVILMAGIVHAVKFLATDAGWRTIADSNIAYCLIIFLYHLLPSTAFVIAGATVAPRHQVATSVVLAVLGVFASLLTHLILQQFAGNRVGYVNWTHVFAEIVGLLAGVAFVVIPVLWRRGTPEAGTKTQRAPI